MIPLLFMLKLEGGMTDMRISQVRTAEGIGDCFDVLKVLRPHLNRETFLEQVLRQQAFGYQIFGIKQGNRFVSVAGYRVVEFLAWGKILYLDDLITLPSSRGQGFAGALLDHLIEVARELGCIAMHLDTGHHRYDAHRLYLSKGFVIKSHHLSLNLN